MIGVGDKSFGKFLTFSCARLEGVAATEWLDGSLRLSKKSVTAAGAEVDEVIAPQKELPEPTMEELQPFPGAWEAYKGLSQLELTTMTIVSSKVKLRADKLKSLGTCSSTIILKSEALTKKHTEEYEFAFQSMSSKKEVADDKKWEKEKAAGDDDSGEES